MNSMRRIYESMARARAERGHAEACARSIARRADSWLPAALKARGQHAEGARELRPGNDDLAAARAARDLDTLRRIRDEG